MRSEETRAARVQSGIRRGAGLSRCPRTSWVSRWTAYTSRWMHSLRRRSGAGNLPRRRLESSASDTRSLTLHLDAARLGLLALGQLEFQHAVTHPRLDARVVDMLVHRELPIVISDVVFGIDRRELTVDTRVHHPGDRQHVVLQHDLDVFVGDT